MKRWSSEKSEQFSGMHMPAAGPAEPVAVSAEPVAGRQSAWQGWQSLRRVMARRVMNTAGDHGRR